MYREKKKRHIDQLATRNNFINIVSQSLTEKISALKCNLPE